MVVVGVMAMAADMAMVTHIMAMDMAILMDMAMVSPTMDMAHPITHHTQLLPAGTRDRIQVATTS